VERGRPSPSSPTSRAPLLWAGQAVQRLRSPMSADTRPAAKRNSRAAGCGSSASALLQASRTTTARWPSGSSMRCLPWHDRRARTGYKSFTLTIPKEVCLFADGHREAATETIHAAVAAALAQTFPRLDISAVAAVHTRNEAGEVHFHVHVLVAKFARDCATGRTVSLNSKAGGNTGDRIWKLKRSWKSEVDRLFKERLGLQVEQRSKTGPVALLLPDGTRLDALNRDSRRALEKLIAPTHQRSDPDGKVVERKIKLGVMDGRNYEVAAGNKGRSRWDVEAFKALFPEQAKYLNRYEKRVETLKAVGYLTDDGKADTRLQGPLRFAPRRRHPGVATSANRSRPPGDARESDAATAGARCRISGRRLTGMSRSADESSASATRATKWHEFTRRPTSAGRPERTFSAFALKSRGAWPWPRRPRSLSGSSPSSAPTSTFRRRRCAGCCLCPAASSPSATARRRAWRTSCCAWPTPICSMPRSADWHKSALRPMMWAIRVAVPREARRLDLAVDRSRGSPDRSSSCVSIARRSAPTWEAWRERQITQPLANLRQAAFALELPSQRPSLPELQRTRAEITKAAVDEAASQYMRGYQVLCRESPGVTRILGRWQGRERALITKVATMAEGGLPSLSVVEYGLARRAARMGLALQKAEAIRARAASTAAQDQRVTKERRRVTVCRWNCRATVLHERRAPGRWCHPPVSPWSRYPPPIRTRPR
jgi:hypothetical protein